MMSFLQKTCMNKEVLPKALFIKRAIASNVVAAIALGVSTACRDG
jgi:hypothetical protein